MGENERLNTKQNQIVFGCWSILCVVLTISYIIEFIKGNRTLEYVLEFCLVCWTPLFICSIINIAIGMEKTSVRYLMAIGYLIFYIYAMATAQSSAVFTYIIPAMAMFIVFNNVALLDTFVILSLIVNGIEIALYCRNGVIIREDVTFFEIQIACLILSFVFLHRIMLFNKRNNEIMLKLNSDIANDTLTQVHNRYFLDDYLNKKFSHSDDNFSLAIIDVDSFKKINDTYGHKFGDQVLIRIAKELRRGTKLLPSTHVVRLGGDEFAIISSKASKEDIYKACTRVCNVISYIKLDCGATEVQFTVSIGVANSLDDKCSNFEKLYEVSDKRLYTVKNNGKCSVAK